MPHQSVIAFDNGQLYQFFFTLKIYNYLNDDFMPLYKMNETVDLYNALKAKHIKYIFVSSYQPSTLLQSQFSNLITDPKYTTLVVNQGNYFLFKINDNLKEVQNAALSTNEEDDVQLTKSTSKIIIYKLKNNKQYSIDIKSLAPGVFYQIAAHTSTRSIANYTFNTNTKFIFFSGPIEQEQLSLEITSKDKPVDLNIKIREIL